MISFKIQGSYTKADRLSMLLVEKSYTSRKMIVNLQFQDHILSAVIVFFMCAHFTVRIALQWSEYWTYLQNIVDFA